MNLGEIDTPEGRSEVEHFAKLIVESSELFSFLNIDKDLKTEWTKNYGYNFWSVIIQNELSSINKNVKK